MKCIKNESVQIYTERAEQVKREKMVAAMLYSCHCSEVCFILVTNDTQSWVMSWRAMPGNEVTVYL